MAPEVTTQREIQEQSIKARKHELFVDDSIQTGPRKRFHEYLRETPPTPLSKSVRMMLWGTAVPIVLVFLGALLTTTKRSTAKPPAGLIIPAQIRSPAAPAKPPARSPAPSSDSQQIAKRSEPPAPAPGSSPSEEKPKTKKVRKNRKPKPEGKSPSGDANKTVEVAKSGGTEKKATEPAGAPPSQAQAGKSEAESKDKPRTEATKTNDGGGKTNTAAATPAPVPEKPKRASLFKKKKPPVYTYPKRESEKKVEDTKPNNPVDNGSR